MIYLTESALKYAVNICEELPRYKVGICPCHREEIEGLMKRVQEYANDVQSVVFTSGAGRNGLDNLIPKISRDKLIEISRAYEESVFKNSSELEQEAVEFVLGKTWMSFKRR